MVCCLARLQVAVADRPDLVADCISAGKDAYRTLAKEKNPSGAARLARAQFLVMELLAHLSTRNTFAAATSLAEVRAAVVRAIVIAVR